MIAVSLLGRVSVSVDGAPISGEAAQRRRVALLALLCMPPARPLSRDRLMLYLWPESDVESARHLLSVAVHVLRKSLGHDVVVTTADEVSVAPGTVEVDVARFEDAVARGDHEAAVALYGGPFMDGFHAGAGVEVEQWIDGERTRLQRAYAQALEGLAEKQRLGGDAIGALDSWGRLAALDPFSSHAALGLMRALAEAGNRAGAIRHAAVHRQLLEGELGAGPDPEVEALAEALRTEAPAIPTPVGAHAGSAAAATASAPGMATAAATVTTEPGEEGVDPAPAAPALVSAPGPAALPAGLSAATPAVLAPDGPHSVPEAPGLPGPSRARRWVIAAAALVVLGLAVGYALRRIAPIEERSVAVLPFTVVPQRPETEYLGDGIAGQVLTELGTVKGLRVVAQASSFAYRGGRVDVHRIGQELGVQWVLNGTVQPFADRIRVTVELSRTSDRVRVWTEQYDEANGDIRLIEDVVARAVARALDRKVREERRAASTANQRAAHDLYLRAHHAWDERTPTSLMAAIDFFQRAVALDSSYAEAYAGLAETLIVAGSYDYGLLPPEVAYPRADSAARRALALDERLPAAHAALANVYLDYEWKLAEAEKQFRRALDLDPRYYSPARQWYALLLVSQGRNEEALLQLDSAAIDNPADAMLFVQRAHVLYYMHEYDGALTELRKALRIDPDLGVANLLVALAEIQRGHAAEVARTMRALSQRGRNPVVMAVLGYASAQAGDLAAARAARDWLLLTARLQYVPSELMALVEVGLNDKAAALDHLEQAFERRSDGMVYLGVEPGLDPLRSEPRFLDLLKRSPAAAMAERGR